MGDGIASRRGDTSSTQSGKNPVQTGRNTPSANPGAPAFVLDKALYEVEYELASRPDWAIIPLLGILRIISAGSGPAVTGD